MELRQHGMPKFEDLVTLRLFLGEIEARQVVSLTQYNDASSGGFFRYDYDRDNPESIGKPSMSSTATCVLSLVATGRWNDGPWKHKAEELARHMLEREWESAGLPLNNPYTVAFALECVKNLVTCLPIERQRQFLEVPELRRRLDNGNRILAEAVADGAVAVAQYPKSAYLTQLAVRVLLSNPHDVAQKLLPEETRSKIREWAWQELNRQLALLIAKSKSADLFQLGYCIILVVSLVDASAFTPDQSLILDAAIDQLFEHQRDDGSWPLGQPLFHDPKVGSAYCYEYEMLVQLLSQPVLVDKLLERLPLLTKSAYALRDSRYNLGQGGWGWSSGHHPQRVGAESWATASVHHFVHAMDRLVAEAIRQSVFAYLNAPYSEPRAPKQDEADFSPNLWDCPLWFNGRKESLRRILFAHFVEPIATQADLVANGRAMSSDTPMAAIFFGPPGTSKTELTRLISDFLNWPRLTVDPSHFVRNGMDQIQAEADRIFSMLAEAERVVVLLDEFDEMVRERQQANEVLSRFLTTAMLPKLAEISKKRRIVFIVATNYIDHFDIAIRRPGRFDMLLQVMPPFAFEKVTRGGTKIMGTLSELGTTVIQKDRLLVDDSTARKIGLSDKLEALTYDEFRSLVSDLEEAHGSADALAIIEETFSACTLRSDWSDTETWADACKRQRMRMRIPRLRKQSGVHIQLVLGDSGSNGLSDAAATPTKRARRTTQKSHQAVTAVPEQN